MRASYAGATVLMTALALLAVTASWSATASAGPPEQGKIAFVRGGDLVYPAGDIWVMNADGSGLAPLTADERNSTPAWSPDGERIAFARARGSPEAGYSTDIWAMNADGSDATRLISDAEDPAWSPDGHRIAFNRVGIWVMNADGTGETLLNANGFDPAWSPDGHRIAFSRGNLWVMNADGSGEGPLGDDGFDPAWSPDGERIAYTGWTPDRIGAVGDEAIRVMNADGSDWTRLISDGRGPTWSPDGGRIAFSFGDDIWAMNADASCLTSLVQGPSSDFSPAWYPLSPPSGPQACFTLSVSTSGPGTGVVTGPPGILCPGAGVGECTASFAAGTELALEARPGTSPPGWSWFAGWDGACAGTGPCRLTMNGDRAVNARFGAPRIRVRARPRQRRVGLDRRRVRYRFVARNVGDASWRVRLCARDPQRRVRVLGKRCVTRRIPPGARRQRAVKVRIRPAARGKPNRIRLIARLGPGVENQQTFARLRVRR